MCRPEIPESSWKCPVIDGDANDGQFFDPAGATVGRKVNGCAKTDIYGFNIRHMQPVRRNIGNLTLAN